MKRVLILAGCILGNAANGQTPVGFTTNCPTCVNGQCGPVRTVAANTVQYVQSVGQAITAPVRERGLFPRLREAIQTRPRLFSRCR